MGVVELRPQITVVPQEPFEKSQPFSVPFRIENAGYLSFWLERPFCYYHFVKAGAVQVFKSTSHEPGANHHTIDRNEAETITCPLLKAPVAPAKADVAIVVDYKPWQWFPWAFRKYYRFTGMYGDSWQWTKQPSEAIQADADAAVEDHMRQIPQSK